MEKRFIFYIVFTFFNIFLGKEPTGICSTYLISDFNVLLFIIIPIMEIFCNKKKLVKILMIIPIIFIVIILFNRRYERENFIPRVYKCLSAYACECNDIDKLCKCKYCKEFNNSNECINETYIECDVK